MALGANLAAVSAERLTGATVLFWTSSPSQSWAPTTMSGPFPTLAASLNALRVSAAIWTATLMPFSWPNWSAYFLMMGARSASLQMTRSAAASRAGGPLALGAGAAEVLVELLAAGVVDPPQALINSAATPVTATAPIARLCMKFSPWEAPASPAASP